MGLKLESFRKTTREVKEERENVYEDFAELAEQAKPLDFLSGLEGFADVPSADVIRRTIEQHSSDTEHVRSRSQAVEGTAKALTNDINEEIRKAEGVLSGIRLMAEARSTSGFEKESALCREHIASLRKLLDELESVNNSSGEYDFFSGSYADERKRLNEIHSTVNNLVVQGRRFSLPVSLSPDEISALRTYTSEQYKYINGYLRGKMSLPPGQEEHFQRTIRILHECLSSERTEKSVKVYRGLFSNTLPGNLTDDELEGKVIHDPAFMSTTFDRHVAERYSKGTIFEISVPAGTRGMYVGSLSSYPDENEFLIDSNQIMRIDRVEYTNSTRIIHASILIQQDDGGVRNCPVEGRGGQWSGARGNSEWIINQDYVPQNSITNPDGLSWREINEKCGTNVRKIPFTGGYPDFTEITRCAVDIDNFSTDRAANFYLADEKLAVIMGADRLTAANYRKQNGLTWHEHQNCRTMQLVPSLIHNNIAHRGGIAKKKSLDDGDSTQ